MSVQIHAVEHTRVVGDVPGSLEELLERAGEHIQGPRRAGALHLIEDAYAFAAEAHAGQKRLSGDEYITHPLAVALLLTELRLDEVAIAAALLHDTIEDAGADFKSIQDRFGHEVADLVEGVTKLGMLEITNLEEEQAQSLRKMFLAMARDIRVVMVKLADRLHNIRTVSALPAEKRKRFCDETLEIYAPLAGRLGIFHWKWQLEDGSFRELSPVRYRELAESLDSRREERENLVNEVMEQLRVKLEEAGLDAEVSGRAKHLYSIDRKMREAHIETDEIYDLMAVRIVVRSVDDCYQALAVVHARWRAVSGQFDDYISAPKSNNYQSLHTALSGPGGKPFEVQIRTEEMHWEAELGVAAHWRYKEGHLGQEDFVKKLAWVRQVLEWQEDLDTAAPFVDILKADIFGDQVLVFTPNGDVLDLPRGATPLDFAYRIHTEVGHGCIGAKVNGRLVPLKRELESGDTIEILTGKSGHGPSRDWLTIVQTGYARDKVRQWFKRQKRAENEEFGRTLLNDELGRIGHEGLAQVGEEDLQRVIKRLSFSNLEGLLAAIGYGAVTATQVINRLGIEPAREPFLPVPGGAEVVHPRPPTIPTGVNVAGTGDLHTRLGSCCIPLPGDEIVGYITRGRGVTVHRADCPNITKTDEPERLIDVSWSAQRIESTVRLPTRLAPCCNPTPEQDIVGVRDGGEVVVHAVDCEKVAGKDPIEVSWGEPEEAFFLARIKLTATDRGGLLRDVAAVVAEEGYSIVSATVDTTVDGVAEMTVSLNLSNISELSRLLHRLQSIRQVLTASREAPTSRPR